MLGGDDEIQAVYQSLFLMAESSDRALNYCEQRFTDQMFQPVFKRIHEANRSYYSAYMTILALAAGTDINLGERLASPDEDVARTRRFFTESRDLITNRFNRFEICFAAVYTVMGQLVLEVSDEKDVLQVMNRKIIHAGFTRLLQSTKLQLSLLDLA